MTDKLIGKVKIILDDTVKDDLIQVYIDNATDYILNYTNLKEVPATLNSTIVEMAVFQYRNRELENVSSESIGNTSYSFITDYPANITNRLDGHKRVTVV